jgi:hypothetical protein
MRGSIEIASNILTISSLNLEGTKKCVVLKATSGEAWKSVT